MGGFLKVVGKALWKGIRDPVFRELAQGWLHRRLQEQDQKERWERIRGWLSRKRQEQRPEGRAVGR